MFPPDAEGIEAHCQKGDITNEPGALKLKGRK